MQGQWFGFVQGPDFNPSLGTGSCNGKLFVSERLSKVNVEISSVVGYLAVFRLEITAFLAPYMNAVADTGCCYQLLLAIVINVADADGGPATLVSNLESIPLALIAKPGLNTMLI